MPIECDLGRLIIQLNPYTDVQQNPLPIRNRMHFHLAAAPAADPLAPAEDHAAEEAAPDLRRFHLEVDNYEGAWTFKGATFTVTRAVRIVYRYPLRDATGVPNGLYATENLLVGYAGGNGS